MIFRHANLRRCNADEEILSRDSRSPAFVSKGEMLQYAMARHDILPEAALMVGDTMEDVDAARETGIRVVVVKYGYGTEHLRPAPNICAELDDFKQLAMILRKEIDHDR